ncbi:MAG: hypothetical protein E6Q38_00840 [Crocinitomicaceae bacterium]|nr:MAG: hypothetical protein E6Q38_00840 [Crocinitomicaceae bacterium]
MKKTCFAFTASILLLVSCGSESDKTEGKQENKSAINKDKDAGIYGYESGMVETHFGNTKNKEILYFDMWGTKSACYTYSENSATGQVILSAIKIQKGGTSYLIDPVEKTGLKMENPFGQSDIGEAKKILGFQEERKLEMLGSHVVGTENISGKKCKVWKDDAEEMGLTTYTHEGIVLKTIIDMFDEDIISEATDIQFNIKIPADKFEIPKGIKF